MFHRSSLTLVAILLGLSVLGVLFTASEGGFSSCPQPTGSPAYFSALSDGSSSQPLQGVKISGSIAWVCYTTDNPGYVIEYSTVPVMTTSSNGTIMLGSTIGNYTLAVHYLGHTYSISFGPTGNTPTFVKITLPSGAASVMQCTLVSNDDCLNGTSNG